MSIFWQLRQYEGGAEAGVSSARAEGKAQSAVQQVAELDARVDRLALVCMAMWKLLQEHTDLTEEDLMAKVGELDLMDGTPDGRLKQVKRCTKCQRVLSPKHERCMYCGAEKLETTAFDALL